MSVSMHKREQPSAAPQRQPQEQQQWAAPQNDDLDDILDQIDSVLEVNAEEFVRSFVQKGGE